MQAFEIEGLVGTGAAPAVLAYLFHRIGDRLGLQKRLVAVKGSRGVRKKDMIHNSLTPKIEVDPQNYRVRVDGELITCEPATSLPMAQRYFLF